MMTQNEDSTYKKLDLSMIGGEQIDSTRQSIIDIINDPALLAAHAYQRQESSFATKVKLMRAFLDVPNPQVHSSPIVKPTNSKLSRKLARLSSSQEALMDMH